MTLLLVVTVTCNTPLLLTILGLHDNYSKCMLTAETIVFFLSPRGRGGIHLMLKPLETIR